MYFRCFMFYRHAIYMYIVYFVTTSEWGYHQYDTGLAVISHGWLELLSLICFWVNQVTSPRDNNGQVCSCNLDTVGTISSVHLVLVVVWLSVVNFVLFC